MGHLERAVQQAAGWVAVTPIDHSDRTRRIHILDMISAWEYQIRSTLEDIEATNLGDDVSQRIDQEPAVDEIGIQIRHLSNQAARLAGSYQQTGHFEDLKEAVRIMEQGLERGGAYIEPGMLSNLGAMLSMQFKRAGSIDDLNRAVDVTSMAVDATPQDHPDRAGYLNNLGNRLGTRFGRTGSIDDLNRAVDVTSMAVDATPQDHPDRASYLNNFGIRLGTRFDRTGSIDDLNRAVDVTSIAVDFTPQDHPNRAGRLSNLGNWLGTRFDRTGSIDDLNRTVDVTNMVVDAIPQDHPDRASYLNNLGNKLGIRFGRTGSIDDLNRAVDVTSMAVDATPQDHPDRASYLNNFGIRLGMRFDRTGSIDDLNRAVDVTSIAVDFTPQDHPDRAGRLSNLGNWLGTRFDRTGSIDDLNRTVDVTNMVVDAIPQDHPDRASYLNNLGNKLGIRFGRTGSIDDLNRAVDVTNMAVDATPQDHPDRASYLNNFGIRLGTRFDRTGSIDDLNRAVDVTNMAVDATPQDHPDRAGRLSNLGNWLGTRFDRTGSIDDLNRAVDVTNIAVDATSQDHPDRAGYLSNLGSWLGIRFGRTGSINDLNRAVDVTSMAVDATPQDHPDRAGYLNNLGNTLGTRFDRTGSIDDFNRRLSSYKKGWSCHTAPPSIRIRLARAAAKILTSQRKWDESSQLLEKAIKLLPTVSPRFLNHTDKQHMLAGSTGLASMAAAIALNAGKNPSHALQLLELADEFIFLRDELDSPLDRSTSTISSDITSSWESPAKRRREADQKFGELVARIRTQSGFNRFLLPPAEDEIMAAADPDPIIIVSLSSYRCDAFLVERDRIRALELPGLTVEEVQKRAEELRLSRASGSLHITPLLEWLWDVIARPILGALGFKGSVSNNNWPRVWWIPTGLLSQLPLHAAGQYVQGSTETVLDRVMSSYASSVKALIHGRRHLIRRSAEPSSDNALLVAMRETPDMSANRILPFAIEEVEMLEKLCPSLQLRPVTPMLHKDDVLQHLRSCRIFHFAGHGQSNPEEPSQSCLLLEDWKTNPLTAGELRESRLQENPPFLAYLSACSTGANEAVKLADEGIHLVSAFQLAGFRHVIGTLWEVSDKHCVDVARVLYETLRDEGMTDAAVCRGLHRAVRVLRRGGSMIKR
ncbi:CHAT domain-containing protein [Lasiosphaeris hirsuta]|uniref:CHAT domain-containing protein n=1 Tax=Lasiosphaeris hirsuta TaxID=260670 RepID=A0AA40B8L1_9PEZI|nr:CHAT domain-containing protein [Lasiosphaeris hirsuta]